MSKLSVCRSHFVEVEKREPSQKDSGCLDFCVMCPLKSARNHYGVCACYLVDSEKIKGDDILKHELEMTLWRYPTLDLAEGAVVNLLKQRFPNKLIMKFLLPR